MRLLMAGSQKLSERVSGPCQTGLDRGLRLAEPLGDRADGQLVEIAKAEDARVALVQALQGVGDALAHLGGLEQSSGIAASSIRSRARATSAPGTACARARSPRSCGGRWTAASLERRLFPGTLAPLPAVGEGLLDDVVDVARRQVRAAEDERGRGAGRSPERAVELGVHGLEHPKVSRGRQRVSFAENGGLTAATPDLGADPTQIHCPDDA
jgi:hypothetical protein